MELIEITKKLNTQKRCINYLEKARWGDNTTCPYCGSERITGMKKQLRHHCNSCNTSFSVLVGTIFEASNLPLPKWFIAISLVMNARKGISSRQLARHIDVTKDTAWYVQKRLRDAMQNTDKKLLEGIIEVDETYIGGQTKNKHKKVRDALHAQGKVATGAMHKTPVFGILSRSGRVSTQVVEQATGKTLKPIIHDKVDRKSVIVSDGFGAYAGLNKQYHSHEVVNHEKDEYVRGAYHTNNIEGFWSLVKRGIVGQYHKITRKYLQNYLDEFCFKYNFKKEEKIFELFLYNALITNKVKPIATS
ncbi:MAG: IS1595 family transposase [Bacteroidota bacterium]|nr:IS1595 family transposase [Bacteroidota bacterium]